MCHCASMFHIVCFRGVGMSYLDFRGNTVAPLLASYRWYGPSRPAPTPNTEFQIILCHIGVAEPIHGSRRRKR